MPKSSSGARYLVGAVPEHLRRPLVRLQPVLAKKGPPNIDLPALAKVVAGVA
jgi:hypothetical protein